MNILVILAHPGNGSFNHAIASAVRNTLFSNGHHVIFHDLCAEKFDPFLPAEEIPQNSPLPATIHAHCRELQAADGIVIVHPNWWGQPPAILKGWIDRVIRPGVAYQFKENDQGEGVPIGLLKARAALVLNTSNTPEDRERAVFGDPLELLWKQCIFDLCGVRNFHRKMFHVIVTSTLQQRQAWLEEAGHLANKLFPKSFP
ncbi:MAG: NAD(P)H-dependent oxidoreductase [Verrucomicrobiae bacterium]|nr:NAD(P)H-dependent oxidoreductase [Verrucomicrobiae bacterium]